MFFYFTISSLLIQLKMKFVKLLRTKSENLTLVKQIIFPNVLNIYKILSMHVLWMICSFFACFFSATVDCTDFVYRLHWFQPIWKGKGKKWVTRLIPHYPDHIHHWSIEWFQLKPKYNSYVYFFSKLLFNLISFIAEQVHENLPATRHFCLPVRKHNQKRNKLFHNASTYYFAFPHLFSQK